MQHLLLLFAFASVLQGADALKVAAAIPRTQARPHPSVVNPLAALSDGYSELVKEHYLPMAFVQAGILASGADTATQVMESADPVVVAHVLSMATAASMRSRSPTSFGR